VISKAQELDAIMQSTNLSQTDKILAAENLGSAADALGTAREMLQRNHTPAAAELFLSRQKFGRRMMVDCLTGSALERVEVLAEIRRFCGLADTQ